MISSKSISDLFRSRSLQNDESDGWQFDVSYDDAGDDDCLSEQIVSNMNKVHLDDGDVTSDNEETKTKTASYEPLWSADSDCDISDISDEEELYEPKFDISRKDVRSVQPPPLFGGFMLVPVKADEEELFKGHLRMKANRALAVYNSEKGSDYEYVTSCGLTPTRSPDDSGGIGHHMNFWAKTKGTDDDPDLFFSSVSYDDTDDIHCCKLNSVDDEASGIKHCEHINCSECALWKTS